ncbi:hypothetical protein H6F86_10670 [Phormidium sp. FACHB-592]|uniref:Uncharacterized protein n=1 Tax=Stenomitos frigidus AS-A4 TaxID=2933935 RepID=A0ABV0KS05_9CYAN|nr:hypothetical protein [Phormidium sp. FACHB-592]MBD2074340.1 hypothetical protein [Phormidium sp. FACHB-592]
MPIEITLERRKIVLDGNTAALAKGATSRDFLRKQFEHAIALQPSLYTDAGLLQVQTASLNFLITRYSEQLVRNALQEVEFFLSRKRPFYSEPGYAPLYYFSHQVSHASSKASRHTINKSALAAVGEGTAALLLQQLLHARILSRPIHDYPDLVGLGAPTGRQIVNSKLYLTEVKATCMRSVGAMKQTLAEEVFRLAAYTAAAQDLEPSVSMVGLLIGIVVHRIDRFHALLTEVTL